MGIKTEAILLVDDVPVIQFGVRDTANDPVAWLVAELPKGRCLVLLDGAHSETLLQELYARLRHAWNNHSSP